MNWNEKIDSIKKNYSEHEFSVPHIGRKEILRKIETEFIKRDSGYYHSNNFRSIFSNWWDYLDSVDKGCTTISVNKMLKQIYKPNQQCWIACESIDSILIYKATLFPALTLISIARPYTNAFHIIDNKFQFLVGLKFTNDSIEYKWCGNKQIKDRMRINFK